MTAEHAKLRLAVERQTDIEQLRAIALRLLQTVALATASRDMTDNYRVVTKDGAELVSGSRDFCVGYASGRGSYDGEYKVMCGDLEVWPDWGWDE